MNLSSQIESINLIISDVVLPERLFIINNVLFLNLCCLNEQIKKSNKYI